jgi:hypothetical protein
MRFRGLLQLSFIVAFSFSSLAYAGEWRDFDFAKLRKEIKEQNITKLDDLFKIFPAEMKKNPLLVYESRALAPQGASFHAPRMILFNRDASLVMTIAKNPGSTAIEKGKDVLEVIAFDKTNGKFEMYVDSFNGQKVPFEKLDRNPSRCTTCHGSDPRPLFHDYNGWPGLYGSFGTAAVAAKGSKEHTELVSFLASYKSMDRYKELDLSGFYSYPAADRINAQGVVTTPAGSVGTAYKIQGIDGEFQDLLTNFSFAPHIVFGMEIEGLLHKKLAKKLSRRADFDSIVLPILYYLGDETGAFEVVESRCGHPNERTKKVYEKLTSLASGNQQVMEAAISSIEAQVKRDADLRKRAVMLSNILLPKIDMRGIASIPWTAFFPTAINSSPDGETFRKQMALIEVIYQKLGLNNTDISTSRETPTTGIFHLSRLGRMAVDEQYFQNFMRGLKWAVPEKLENLNQMSCDQVETLALDSLNRLFESSPVELKNKGLLYQKK